MSDGDAPELVERLVDGDHRALARAITRIENRSEGHRDLVSALHAHAGTASVVGVTGSPGAGKSTLVDKLTRAYRDRGETVGVIAVDPSSPYTGGAVLGDRIRMGSNVGDMGVFFRSMSTRGQLGGLATATADAVKALDAFGKDRIVVETVGAGQSEVDVVRTADTVVVVVQPGAGDDVQMLKAGILEIGDVFVVNKADLEGASRTVADIEEMLHMRGGDAGSRTGHHGPAAVGAERTTPSGSGADGGEAADSGPADGNETADADEAPDSGHADGDGTSEGAEDWSPPVIETVATSGEGVEELLAALDDHGAYLDRTGKRRERARSRYAAEIRQLLRADAGRLLAEELDRRGGVDDLAEAVLDRETDPYTVVDEVIGPLADCVRERRDEAE